MQKKILLFDIETAPNLGYVWGKWEQDVISFKENWYMISFSWKWLGEKKTHVLSLPNFNGVYKTEKTNDKALVFELWKLFDEADVIIAHNGDKFDIKKANSRFIQHGLKPPRPFRTIDTLKIAKKYFKFDSNKLDDLGEYLRVGKKLKTGGFDLWLGCMSGDKKSWKRMCDYNKQDVILLEQVYLSLRPWIENHPNIDLLRGIISTCPNCLNKNLERRGYGFSNKTIYQRIHCKNCGAWHRGNTVKPESMV